MAFLKWVIAIVMLPTCLVGGIALAVWGKDLVLPVTGLAAGLFAYYWVFRLLYGDPLDPMNDPDRF
jgi:hypothetical protein